MFKPQEHCIKMQGNKEYLEVKWRIVWFRETHPEGSITTELVSVSPDVVFKASVAVDGKILGTGFGTPKMQGIAKMRPYEGAETAAIGRALAVAGFGTQFTGEDEEEHLADAPVERSSMVQESKILGGKIMTWSPEHIKAAQSGYSALSEKVHALKWLDLTGLKPEDSPEKVFELANEYAGIREANKEMKPNEVMAKAKSALETSNFNNAFGLE